MSRFADWVTAVATSTTALFAWFAYRYTLKATDPVVECADPTWSKDGTQVIVDIFIQNRSTVTHKIQRLRIRKPQGATIALPDKQIGPSKEIDLSWLNVYALGTSYPGVVPGMNVNIDQTALSVVVTPSLGWSAGKLRIDLVISDRSLRPRQRRFVISKRIHAIPSNITADTSSKAG